MMHLNRSSHLLCQSKTIDLPKCSFNRGGDSEGRSVNALQQSTCFGQVPIKIYKLLGLNQSLSSLKILQEREDKEDGDDAERIIPHSARLNQPYKAVTGSTFRLNTEIHHTPVLVFLYSGVFYAFERTTSIKNAHICFVKITGYRQTLFTL